MLPKVISMLPSFLAYFGVAMALVAVFLLVYVNVTPYDEISLIRQGNTAAAISLSGALIGFAMPVANVIAHSDALGDLAAWGAIAGVIQLLTYLVARFALPHLAEDIPAGKISEAIFLAALSLVVGLVNAACMTY
jgi:putative membrane protein